uniref:Regulator of telomere elongation helicase 1 homolog n=1 Tax=Eptatretus burgeri TaxID=7764 RepID=A0A8C4QQN9_EPTBU
MPKLFVRGIEVDFPFTPYKCQEDYMERVITCLEMNGVLESPTGTGKTICLLWRGTCMARAPCWPASAVTEGSYSAARIAEWTADSAFRCEIPKIIFASRTHSQLSHAIGELGHTSYRPRTCVLGSREQFCIHPEVAKHESNHVKVFDSVCTFFYDLRILGDLCSPVMICPYYLSRELKQNADLLFMPYNYLLDPKSRKAHGIDLQGSIVIFDEAHNIEQMCEEVASFDLTPHDLAAGIDAVTSFLELKVQTMEQHLQSGDLDSSSPAELLLNLEREIDAIELPTSEGLTREGRYVQCCISKFISIWLDFCFSPICNFATTLTGKVLSYWCFSPGRSMLELISQGIRCLILTSGTLTPLSSFTTELQINFPVQLENPHVIDHHQVWAGVVMRGPDNEQLNSSFHTRFTVAYMTSLGCTIANFCRIVPDGLLVFFPSYPVMGKCLEHWTETGLWKRIEGFKSIFVEPKGKNTFTEVRTEMSCPRVQDSNTSGAAFFAVCRGKVSEGLDFADCHGRAVVVTGLPFPPMLDPRIKLKMQFLDELKIRRQMDGEALTGQAWYRQQASRAVNQAIGRVIRHRFDYGAIILCDHRFSNPESLAQFPCWLRPRITSYTNFGNAVRELTQFFRRGSFNEAPAPPFTRPNLKQEPPPFRGKRPGTVFHSTMPARSKPQSCSDNMTKHDMARGYLTQVKCALSHQNYGTFTKALRSYKETENLPALLDCLREIFASDPRMHSLFRDFYGFVRPQHKQAFEAAYQSIVGLGSGTSVQDGKLHAQQARVLWNPLQHPTENRTSKHQPVYIYLLN